MKTAGRHSGLWSKSIAACSKSIIARNYDVFSERVSLTMPRSQALWPEGLCGDPIAAANDNPQRRTVAIIGGGLAGLSAGSALADAGYQVELFERRPYLGGRASSYELPGTGEVVDNCQHVLLGCCTNLIDFYRRLGVEQQIRWYDEINFILPDGKSSTLKPGALPAPSSCDGIIPRIVGHRPQRQAAIARAMMAMIPSLPPHDKAKFSAVAGAPWADEARHRALLGAGADQRAQRGAGPYFGALRHAGLS